jgi:hypothetical protein
LDSFIDKGIGKQSSVLSCPICGKEVNYLLGEDALGGRIGCENCWKPPTHREEVEHGNPQEATGILS